MAQLFNKSEYVVSKLRLLVGDPILAAVQSDIDAITTAINIAHLQYWTALPYEYNQQVEVTVNSTGEVYNSIDTLKSQAFSDVTVRDKSYYLGVVRMSEAPYQMRNLTSYLLGRAVLNHPYINPKSGRIDLNNILLYNTEREMLQGDVEIRYDTVNQNVIYTVPIGFTQYSFTHGFGFYDQELTYVPENNLQMLAKMAAIEYLDALITARSAITLEADYGVNVDYLKERRNELKQEVKEQIVMMAPIPILRG